jgi:hypothetical protein
VVAIKNKKQGLIDSMGNYVLAKRFEKIQPLSEGLAAIQKNNKWGYVNMASKEIIPCIYQTAGDFKNALAVVMKNGKVGFVNQVGKVVINFMYDEATNFNAFGQYWSLVTLSNKVGIINMNGVEIIPCEMDEIEKEDIHLLKIQKDSKMAYFDIISNLYLWKEEGF